MNTQQYGELVDALVEPLAPKDPTSIKIPIKRSNYFAT
jgi:hypothetical protein